MNTRLEHLRAVMARLRDKETGCPWDIVQDFKSIVPYTIEEAYEVADAIDRGHMRDLKEELGDLLLQVVYHAQMAEEQGMFTLDDVAESVANKMISRHPHVFGDQKARTAEDVTHIWDAQKYAEKPQKNSVLDGVTRGLPALLRAEKLQKKAAKVGYVWPDTASAFHKLEEELAEFKSALEQGDAAHQDEEWGDILFCLVNYARMNGMNSEESLRRASAKFERRFKGMEAALKEDGYADLTQITLEIWLDYWKKQKNLESSTE
ncbi:MAG: nucleoside triphosphate pyrophosphohydrolase [Alphaproteobacteria bacterium]|nr:nucleoside triphosphate pyrophosphohydrolase [Alphaproteobacteria bacterium]